MRLNFRYAASKREAFGANFLLFSLAYFFATTGLRALMTPAFGVPIAAIVHDSDGYHAVTARQTGKQPYSIKITRQQYQQFECSSHVQLALLILYIGIVMLFRRYYYDPKRWLNQDL